MKMRWYILLLSFTLFYTVGDASDSYAQGSVTVHSDPRLSILVRKPHNVDHVAAPAKKKPKKVSGPIAKATPGDMTASAVVSKPVAPASAPVAGTVTTGKTAAPAAAPAATPLPMENGHVAGWTPPVHRKARVIYSGKGFRVQIYNGQDRNKAIMVKTEFMRMYPGIRTYLTYATPSFRVKVGDYRNRSDAMGMWKEANSMYNPSMIVPDIVTISTF